MKRVVFGVALSLLCLLGCSGGSKTKVDGVKKVIYHYNVMIVPDLSNRIIDDMYPKPVADQQIISSVLDLIYPEILTISRQENQQDIFRISFINEGVIKLYDLNMANLEIDFSKFKSQLNRIDYVIGKANPSLDSDLELYKKELEKAYHKAEQATYGADIWSFFNKVDEYFSKDIIRSFTYEGNEYLEKYKNIMILLTDGYLEAGIYDQNGCQSENTCYFMSGRTIKQFRDAFKKSGMDDMKAFFEKENYGIVPVKNEALKNLEVLLLEAYDRSLDTSGNATVFPSDYEIMKLFWEDWMMKSGVKSFEMHQTVSNKNEAIEKIKNFIKVR